MKKKMKKVVKKCSNKKQCASEPVESLQMKAEALVVSMAAQCVVERLAAFCNYPGIDAQSKIRCFRDIDKSLSTGMNLA